MIAATARRSAATVRIERGTPADLDALAPLHYRAGRPAFPVLVLIAREEGELAGVLSVSMPVLNGPWRARLWPGEFGGAPDPRGAARAANRGVRTISRVIVERRFRGRGIGAALVRAYLDAPLTRFTEAIAAAGSWSPVFARAGMRALALAPARRDERLARTLRTLRIPAWTLIEVGAAARQMRRREVREAVERWARDGKGTRRLIGVRPAWELAARAASSVLSRPTVYGADANSAPALRAGITRG